MEFILKTLLLAHCLICHVLKGVSNQYYQLSKEMIVLEPQMKHTALKFMV